MSTVKSSVAVFLKLSWCASKANEERWKYWLKIIDEDSAMDEVRVTQQNHNA